MAYVVLYVVLLLIGMTGAAELGRRLAVRSLRLLPAGASLQSGAFETSTLGLLGLLLAFTFSGAADRFDQRRSLIIQETNDIGTAWLRLDLLPEDVREDARARFRAYVDARLDYYRALARDESLDAAESLVVERQGELWTTCVAGAVQTPDPATRMLLLSALNAMFDTGTERTLRLLVHPPLAVYALLFIMAIVSATVVGYGGGDRPRRDWLHRIAFGVMVSLTVYVTLDIEVPRHGLISIESFDASLIELRARLR